MGVLVGVQVGVAVATAAGVFVAVGWALVGPGVGTIYSIWSCGRTDSDG